MGLAVMPEAVYYQSTLHAVLETAGEGILT
jgi:hypothetical protein